MNNEGKFKKSLGDLIQSKEFEFDEGNWEKASAMIDNYRKGSDRKGAVILTSVLVVTLLLFTAGWLFWPSTDSNSVISEHSTKPTSQHRVAPHEKETKNAEAGSPVKEHAVLPNKNTNPPHHSSLTVAIPKAISQQDTKSQTNVAKPLHTTSEKTTAQANLVAAQSKSIEAPKPALAGVQALSLSIKTNETEPDEDVVDSEKPLGKLLPINKPSETNVRVLETAGDKQNIASNHVADETTPVSQNPSSPTESAATDTNTSTQTTNPLPEDSTSQFIATSEPLKGVGIYPLMPVADSAMLANETAVTFEPKDKPLLFSIEAGVSYLYGWKNPGKTDANGYNPFVGVNYFQNLLDRLSVSVGIQYTSISRLSYSSHTTKVSQLGLGEESTVTVFTPTKVHYLLMPLRFHYRLSPRDVVGIGCNLAYLLTVETEVETYHQNILGTGGHTLYKDKGYTEGFKPYDLQLTAQYRRRLNYNLAFQAEVFYGLSDVKDNQFFRSRVFERNSGIKLALVYNFQKP